MSLICGILSKREPELATEEALEAMLAVTRHRGRDGQETFVAPADGIALAYCHTATFGHRKDAPSWHQDEAVVAAVDGDIYDTASHLQGRAWSFKSPEAGAVVASFGANPDDFPASLDGFFSLFLWDRRSKTLHLSADQLGRRMLYYFHDPARELAVFSSELKAVLAHPGVTRQLDRGLLPL